MLRYGARSDGAHDDCESSLPCARSVLLFGARSDALGVPGSVGVVRESVADRVWHAGMGCNRGWS